MSMLPLTGLFDLALSFITVPTQVQDVVITTANGQDIQGVPTTRTIEAGIDPTNRKQLEVIFGGSVTDGSVGVITKETLYIDDMYAAGDTRQQSFVVGSDGTAYRITDSAPWTQQTGFSVYLAKRHVPRQESEI